MGSCRPTFVVLVQRSQCWNRDAESGLRGRREVGGMGEEVERKMEM